MQHSSTRRVHPDLPLLPLHRVALQRQGAMCIPSNKCTVCAGRVVAASAFRQDRIVYCVCWCFGVLCVYACMVCMAVYCELRGWYCIRWLLPHVLRVSLLSVHGRCWFRDWGGFALAPQKEVQKEEAKGCVVAVHRSLSIPSLNCRPNYLENINGMETI